MSTLACASLSIPTMVAPGSSQDGFVEIPLTSSANGTVLSRNTNSPTLAPRNPLGSITNTYKFNPATDEARHSYRPWAPKLKRVPACPDLRSVSQHPSTSGSDIVSPGSFEWQSDKAKLLNDVRSWNTRVKSESAARRLSLPLLSTSSAPLSTRRASAPPSLGTARPTVEDRLRRAVSACPTHTAQADEVQFTIGEDEEEYLEEDTCVSNSSLPDAKAIMAVPSELPYLSSVPVFPAAEPLPSSESIGTLTDMLDALEAVFSTSRWLSLVDLARAAGREEARLRTTAD
jgi:hypothetical protein